MAGWDWTWAPRPSSATRSGCAAPGPCSGTARWVPSRWNRSPPGHAPWPRRWRTPPAPRSSAAATRRPLCPNSGWPTALHICRPVAELRSSCWRERSSLEWRRWMTPDQRRPYIAGNWKMFKTTADAREYTQKLLARLPLGNGVEVAICPPFTALAATLDGLGGSEVKVLAQNMHQEPEGAYTGEVSAAMLVDLGVHGTLLGHSERRQYFNETDRALQDKVPAALAAGLQPMLCVGESEEEREAGDTQRKLRHQVQEALERVSDEQLAEVVIAYEPIWAIGTGQVAPPEMAQDAIGFIRALVGDRSNDAADRVRVLYGGSVKPDNAAEILAQPDIDGALVGGASLEPDSLVEIVKAAAALAKCASRP